VHDQEQVGAQKFKWEIFEHSPRSSDLVLCDYHLFLRLKKLRTGQSLRSVQQTKEVVQDWMKGLVATFFDEGIQKLVPRHHKRLDVPGDYVQK
jgi:hypothetical protein